MADFNREGIARIERQWDSLPLPHGPPAPKNHGFAEDLDIYGVGSLLHLADTCATQPGRRTLRSWLLAPAGADIVSMRQEAVSEMARAFDFRDRLVAEARLAVWAGSKPTGVSDPASEPTCFLSWAEGDPWLPKRRWLLAFAVLLPPMNVSALVLYGLGLAPAPAAAWPLLASLVVLGICRKKMSRVFDQASGGEAGVRAYGPLLAHLAASGGVLRSRLAADWRDRLLVKGAKGSPLRSADAEIRRLRRLLDMADARRSPLFHIPLAVILFWDVHVLAALERWKARSGNHVRDWLRAMGEAEALSALSVLAADHPDWTMPTIDGDAVSLRGQGLGHPLLPPQLCVRNNIEIGPAGSFVLVTGSNMSGKSTLLRAIGINVVLAQAGGPVCAESMRLPPLRVATSMRIRDSLTEGVSFFLAELRRLKKVVDAAERPDGPATLYLLDEILQGTNSAERRIAARSVIRQLLDSRAIGAVTTHDLSLADADDLAARSVALHFTESVGDDDKGLSFDYRLRSGIATSTNALRLLAVAGLAPKG